MICTLLKCHDFYKLVEVYCRGFIHINLKRKEYTIQLNLRPLELTSIRGSFIAHPYRNPIFAQFFAWEGVGDENDIGNFFKWDLRQKVPF